MTDKVIVACALLLIVGYAWMTEQVPTRAFGDPLGPKAFPRLLTAVLIVAVLLLIAEMIVSRRSKQVSAAPAPDNAGDGAAPALAAANANWVIAATVAFTGVYFFLFEPLGFVLSSSAYLFAMTMYFNRGSTVANALVSLLLPISCYLVFTRVLGVELARGILPL
ncbi:MAG: tripartite tricarboxylate transporter TctB family protein [Xanthobacteraceae bacterium]|nr:tripartite tricarboxylate transporter TctB family protein [Xanthobacteraceae bacterium]